MGLNSHPELLVQIDGVPVSGVFFERLVSLNITDREGIQSDTLEFVFNDAPPHFASPRRGAVASVTIGYGDGLRAFVGDYVIDSVIFECLPYTIRVSGHSADLRSEMKANKSRHWDQSSVKNIVSGIADEYGLELKISDEVSGYVYPWIGQQDESDLNFLERLARRHGALFTIKNGSMLWLKRGAGKTADGTQIPTVIVASSEIVVGSCRVSEGDVDRFGEVIALYQDRAGAARQEVTVIGDPEALGEHVIRTPFGSKAEAQLAAQAYAAEMLRGLISTSCTIVGRPTLMAGWPIAYSGVRPDVDGREFITSLVKHSYSKSSGLRTMFEGKLKSVASSRDGGV